MKFAVLIVASLLALSAVAVSGCVTTDRVLSGGSCCRPGATGNAQNESAEPAPSCHAGNRTGTSQNFTVANVVFQHAETITTGTPNASQNKFDVAVPNANKSTFTFSTIIRPHCTSGAGAGEVAVLLIDGNSNVVFQNIYAADGFDSIELSPGGGAYTLIVEGAGGGDMFIVGYEAAVISEKSSGAPSCH